MKPSLALKTLIACTATLMLPIFAHSEAVVVPQSLGFSNTMSTYPNEGELYFAYDMRSSNDWESKVVEHALPFKGFKSFETWNVGQDTNETIIYKSETALVVNKSLDQLGLERFESTDFLTSIDPAFKHKETTPDQFNAAFNASMTEGYESARQIPDKLLERGRIEESERNRQVTAIEAQHKLNTGHAWCKDDGVKCLFSVQEFSSVIQGVIAGVNTIAEFPNQIEIYTEVRRMNADELSAKGADAGISQLSPLANKALVSMRNDFYFKKISNTQTVMIIENTIMIEKDDLDKFSNPIFNAYDFMIGQSMLNMDEGLLMGLPRLNQVLAERLGSAL